MLSRKPDLKSWISYQSLVPHLCVKATELAELTSKISKLEDAKKKKDEEAKRWQTRVSISEKVK